MKLVGFNKNGIDYIIAWEESVATVNSRVASSYLGNHALSTICLNCMHMNYAWLHSYMDGD